jgi:hypothetical protein
MEQIKLFVPGDKLYPMTILKGIERAKRRSKNSAMIKDDKVYPCLKITRTRICPTSNREIISLKRRQ